MRYQGRHTKSLGEGKAYLHCIARRQGGVFCWKGPILALIKEHKKSMTKEKTPAWVSQLGDTSNLKRHGQIRSLRSKDFFKQSGGAKEKGADTAIRGRNKSLGESSQTNWGQRGRKDGGRKPRGGGVRKVSEWKKRGCRERTLPGLYANDH